jgi:hypothetical protein
MLKALGCPIETDAEAFEANGLTLKNYPRKYLKDPTIIHNAFSFIKDFLPERHTGRFYQVPVSRSIIFDILFLSNDSINSFGINTGNGNLMTSNEDIGVFMARQQHYKIIEAFRWVQPLPH